jgi:hypothetical protein
MQFGTDGPGVGEEQEVVCSAVFIPMTNIRLLVLGDYASQINGIINTIQTTRIFFGYTQTISTESYLINPTYTGSDITTEKYDVIIIYTNGGMTFNANLGFALNTFVAQGGNLILGDYSWGNVAPIKNLTYTNTPFVYNGRQTSMTTGTFTAVNHPITTGLGNTLTGIPAASIVQGISTQPRAASIATFASGSHFIAVQEIDRSRQIGFNMYLPFCVTDATFAKLLTRAIYWSVKLI